MLRPPRPVGVRFLHYFALAAYEEETYRASRPPLLIDIGLLRRREGTGSCQPLTNWCVKGANLV